MVMAMIGSGNAGGTLTRLWVAAEHDVRVAGREQPAEMVKNAEAVAICVPRSASEPALSACSDRSGRASEAWPNLCVNGSGTERR